MDQHLLDFLKTIKVNPEEAYRCSIDKKQFEQYLPLGGAAATGGH